MLQGEKTHARISHTHDKVLGMLQTKRSEKSKNKISSKLNTNWVCIVNVCMIIASVPITHKRNVWRCVLHTAFQEFYEWKSSFIQILEPQLEKCHLTNRMWTGVLFIQKRHLLKTMYGLNYSWRVLLKNVWTWGVKQCQISFINIQHTCGNRMIENRKERFGNF